MSSSNLRPAFAACGLALGFLVLPLLAHAQSWRWVQPQPTAADLFDVAIDGSTLVAVGAHGTVVRSIDGGSTWGVVADTGTSSTLVAVSALNGRVVAAGEGILRSLDGGATFTRVQAGSQVRFVDVQLVDATTAFALADDGRVWRTADFFTTFAAAEHAQVPQARTLYFQDARTGWVGGADASGTGLVSVTSDGGRTWQRAFVGGAMLTRFSGISLGGFSFLVGSTSGFGVIVGGSAPGVSWEAAPFPQNEQTSVALLPVANGGAEIWIVGAGGLSVTRTEDADMQRPWTGTRPRLRAVASTTLGSAIAVGQGGTIVRATYGQPTAVTLAGGRSEHFTGGSFPTADGQFGVLIDNQPGAPRPLTTDNGGASFVPGQLAPAPIRQVAFVDARSGFGLSADGQLFASTDGGGTWASRGPRFTSIPRGIAFQSETQGYAITATGLLVTRDGGRTWTNGTGVPPLRGSLTAIAVRGTVAAACTDRGEVLQRGAGDIGASWNLLVSTTTWNCAAIDVAADGRIVAGGAGMNGGFAVTSDPTGSMAPITLPGPVRAVSIAGARTFALVGASHLVELANGAAVSAFDARADLSGLATRTLAQADGLVAATFAFGDFGALLVWGEDGVPSNRAPIVSLAATELEVAAGAVFVLDASASHDPEGGALTFAWTQRGGPAVTLIDPNSAITRATAGDAGSTYAFVVRVCDPAGACSEGSVRVRVGQPGGNRPPDLVVDTPALNASVGERVRLRATATDPEGGPVRVVWRANEPGITLTTVGPGEVEFVVPASAMGRTLGFAVEACDAQDACVSGSAVVTIDDGLPFTVDAGPDRTLVAAPLPVSTELHATSVTAVTSWQWRVVSGGDVSFSEPVQARTEARFDDLGTFVIEVVALDDSGRQATDRVVVTVSGPSFPIARAGADKEVGFGARVELDGRASSGLSTTGLTFRWTAPDGIALAGADRPVAIFYAPARATVLDFELEVCAGPTLCSTDDVRVTVKPGANLPPLPDAGPDRTGNGGDVLALDGSFSLDPEGAPLSFTWTQLSGPDAVIESPTAAWSRVTLPYVAMPATLVFEVRVCDPARACATDTTRIEVLPRDARSPVVVASVKDSPDGAIEEDAEFEFEVDVTCPAAPCDGQPGLTVLQGPAIARVDSTGFRYHAPTVSRDTRLLVEIVACDTEGRCGMTAVEAVVRDTVNESPVALVSEPQTARARQRVVLDASRSFDPNGERLSFSWRQTAGPDNVALDFDDLERVRFLAPDDDSEQVYAFEVTVCDERQACDSAVALVTVVAGEPPFNRAPIAHAGGDRTGPVGRPITLDGSRSFDADGDALRFEWRLLESAPAELVDSASEKAMLLVAEPLTTPIRIGLTVCDEYGACGTDEVLVTAYAMPLDDGRGEVTLGEIVGCRCDATGGPGVALLLALGLLLRRRRA